MQLEENQNHRGRGVSGSHPYAGGDTAQDCGIEFHGISKGKK